MTEPGVLTHGPRRSAPCLRRYRSLPYRGGGREEPALPPSAGGEGMSTDIQSVVNVLADGVVERSGRLRRSTPTLRWPGSTSP